ncbi:MAG: MMPL family transporter [Oscillospiraceae bacterium]|nr:MMPL family transporter [Oscillospiraceae bacterium]
MERAPRSESFTQRVAAFIVDKRKIFFLLYLFAAVFCVIAMGWTKVENDVTSYLPEETETRQGIVAMNDNFESFGTARIMVSNVTYDTAKELGDSIAEVPGVVMVTFDNTEEHYKDAAALYDVNFAGSGTDEETLAAMETIRGMLKGHDASVDTTIGHDDIAMLRDEMAVILVVAVIIILGVLTLTSRSYAEIPVLLITFGAAALLNMGTNFIFKKISFISDSVAVVLQLALAIDYAIILCHRFSDEHETKSARDAAVDALAKAIPEISASSLTTVGGLVALGFMEFGIGLDMSVVLIKAILMSLLSVFTLMPGLLVLFCPLIDKTMHRKLLPDITPLGKFAVKTRRVVPPVFAVVLVAAFILSSACPYCYSFTDLKTAKMSERQEAYFKITETFGTSNMAAILVPVGDYDAEQAILEELESRDEVKGTMGLATIEAMEGYRLADALTPRELSELIGLDYELVQFLYSAYAAEQSQFGEILSGVENYRVPLFDMFIFLKDQMDSFNISLDGALGGDTAGMGDMTGMLDQLETAQKQMKSEHYSRMVVYLNLPEESEETFAFLDEMRSIIGKYYEDDYYVVGNSTSSRDLAASFVKDNLLISLLSAFFVILVLLFTFRSVGMPILLIVVIQGAIWINFSVPTLTGVPLYFLGYLIVNAIQMGANIDYAIVISNHYQEKKKEMPHKQAIVEALNAAFPTVFTSGTMMASAGILIGQMSAQPVISIMGSCIGRGTIISIILVLTVLPAILVLGDSIIERTKFRIKGPSVPRVREETGTMRVHGHVRGYISGMVDADIDGIVRGELKATISTDGEVEKESGGKPDETEN